MERHAKASAVDSRDCHCTNRLRSRARLLLLLTFAAGFAIVGSAAAAPNHVFSTTFSGSGASTIGAPRDVAIDHRTGDVYVADDDDFFNKEDGQGNNRILKFDAEGNFILTFGRGVNKTTGGDVCTAASGDVCGPGVEGKLPGEFTHVHFVAVDNSDGPSEGSVYTADIGKAPFLFDPENGPNDPQDPTVQRVQKFNSGGVVQTEFGDALPIPNGTLQAHEALNDPSPCLATGFPSTGLGGVTIDSLGRIYMMCRGVILRFSENGDYQTEYNSAGGGQFGIDVDSRSRTYSIPRANVPFGEGGSSPIGRGAGIGRSDPFSTTQLIPILSESPGPVALALDHSGDDVYAIWGVNDHTGGTVVKHFGADCAPSCIVLDEFGEGQLNGARGISINPVNDDAYVANTDDDNIAIFSGTVPGVFTDPASELGQTSATLSGEVDPLGRGDVTECYFEYGLTQSYGTQVPCTPDPAESPPGSHFTAPTEVTAQLTGLKKATTYHFRLVAKNTSGSNPSANRILATTQPPSIKGVFSSNLREDSAVLNAVINPNSLETDYHFEFGKTINYGQTVPVPAGTIEASAADRTVSETISGLDGGTYHFRLVAENELGKRVSPNQTFNFFPQECPNQRVRQQTGAAYLPDCRAYELVSPRFAGGTFFAPDAPAVPFGMNPNGRLGYMGVFNIIPDAGPAINYYGDFYVATRGSDGWTTRYVGVPSSESKYSGGPEPLAFLGSPNDIKADTTMSRFMTWNYQPITSFAPYVWDNQGEGLGRLPTNVAEFPGALEHEAFQSASAPSPDFNHYVFSTNDIAFAEGGKTAAPGSVYDNAIADGSLTIVSKTPGGEDIPQDPAVSNSNEYIRIPAVSVDGSHILMSTQAPGGQVHLYMTVDHTDHYDVSLGHDGENHGVEFKGMARDGANVFLTSTVQLTLDDTDTSRDLFMWSESTGEVTRLSTGTGGSGNSSGCSAGWVAGCGVEVVPLAPRRDSLTEESTSSADNSHAADAGDVYFYSPEILIGDERAIEGQKNLYVARKGTVQYVATLPPSTSQDLERLQVTPDGRTAAFSTATKLTAYDNQGTIQMYAYTPEDGEIVCASCKQNGNPPTSDVSGSQNGRFITDDGRVFFSTKDALNSRDINGINDVYEYVEGRPQLISTGTGQIELSTFLPIGLVGVSADGIDVFFSAYETLVAQDDNGAALKYYTARSNGGFPADPPPPGCAAADECHAGSTPAPEQLTVGSGATLGSRGNHQSSEPRKRRCAKPTRKGRRQSKRMCKRRAKCRQRVRKTAGSNRRAGR